jgi:hypothetical protein
LVGSEVGGLGGAHFNVRAQTMNSEVPPYQARVSFFAAADARPQRDTADASTGLRASGLRRRLNAIRRMREVKLQDDERTCETPQAPCASLRLGLDLGLGLGGLLPARLASLVPLAPVGLVLCRVDHACAAERSRSNATRHNETQCNTTQGHARQHRRNAVKCNTLQYIATECSSECLARAACADGRASPPGRRARGILGFRGLRGLQLLGPSSSPAPRPASSPAPRPPRSCAKPHRERQRFMRRRRTTTCDSVLQHLMGRRHATACDSMRQHATACNNMQLAMPACSDSQSMPTSS